MNQDNVDQSAQIDKLKTYIQSHIQQGFQPNEIMQQLKQGGWSDDIIQQAFQRVQTQVMPTTADTPAPQTAPVSPAQQTDFSGKRRGRIKTGWLLFKQSIRVLKSNKILARYVIFSALYSLALLIIYGIIMGVGHNTFLTKSTDALGRTQWTPSTAGLLPTFIYYILAFFIVNYYSAALAAHVLDLFHGTQKPVKFYMERARSKAGTLFVYSVIEATVGLILRAIAERSKLLGRIVVAIIGALWSIARLFVVPVIITSDDNAVAAIKDSIKLLKQTWGENIVGRVTMGTVFFLIYIFVFFPIGLILVVLGGVVGGGIGAVTAIVLVLAMLVVFAVIASTASNILNVALFYYAKNKQIPAAFDADLINATFIHKKPRRGLLRKKAA